MTFRCSWSMADPAGCDNDAAAWVDGLAVCEAHSARSVVESITLEGRSTAVVDAERVRVDGGPSMTPRLAAITYGVGFDPIEEAV